MKPTVEIDWETADRICLCVMDDLIECLELDLVVGIPVFVKNKTRDRELIKKHLEAVKLIKKYMTPHEV